MSLDVLVGALRGMQDGSWRECPDSRLRGNDGRGGGNDVMGTGYDVMGAGYDAMPAGHAVMGAGTRAACAPNPQHAHVIPA